MPKFLVNHTKVSRSTGNPNSCPVDVEMRFSPNRQSRAVLMDAGRIPKPIVIDDRNYHIKPATLCLVCQGGGHQANECATQAYAPLGRPFRSVGGGLATLKGKGTAKN